MLVCHRLSDRSHQIDASVDVGAEQGAAVVKMLFGWMGSSGGLDRFLAGVVPCTVRSAALEFITDAYQGYQACSG